MCWNCPHCGTSLGIGDDKIGNGWSFSRCYKCGGFALIKRSDINLIKVDQVPAGERVLLPEASEEPRLNQEATARLNQHLNRIAQKNGASAAQTSNNNMPAANNAKPQIRQAGPRGANMGAQPPAFTHNNSLANPAISAAANSNANSIPIPTSSMAIPEPLPEAPIPSSRGRLLPVAISSAALITVASGTYLYIQGQALWQKARTTAAKAPQNPIQARAIAKNEITPVPASNTAPAAVVVDRVTHQAMAPIHVNTEAKTESKSESAPLVVQPINPEAVLRSGPGHEYAVIGTAPTTSKYLVSDWSDRWFKVVPVNQKDSAQAKPAWIRNDLVRISSR